MHGARPLILVPQFGTELAREHELRRRIVEEVGLPHIVVPLDPRWRVWTGAHPDERAAHAMAAAVSARLLAR